MENFNGEDQHYQTIFQKYYTQVSELKKAVKTNPSSVNLDALNETLVLMQDCIATRYEDYYISKGSTISDFINLKSKFPELDYLCYAKEKLDNFFRANADELFIMSEGETYDTTIIPWMNSLPSLKSEELGNQLRARGKSKVLHNCGKFHLVRPKAKEIIHLNMKDLTQIKIDGKRIMLKKCIVNILFQYRVFGFYKTDVQRCTSSVATESNGKRPITAVSSSNLPQQTAKKSKPSETVSSQSSSANSPSMVLNPFFAPNNVVQTIEAVIVNVELQDLPTNFIFERVDNGFVSVIRENYKECVWEGIPAFKIFFHAPKREDTDTFMTKVVANTLQHGFVYFEPIEELNAVSQLQQQAEMPVDVYNTVTNFDGFDLYKSHHPTNKNPIHIAAFFDDVDYLEALDEDILRVYWNTVDKNGETPYMVAQTCKSNAVLEFFDNLGFFVDKEDSVQKTYQEVAPTKDDTKQVDKFDSKSPNPLTIDLKLHRDVNAVYLEANQLFNHDIDKAIELYKVAADAGHLESMVALAECLELTNDYVSAHVWFEKAAQQGNVEAMKHTAQNYEAGRGCKPNIMKARLWYSQASQKGDDFAAKQLDRL